jgi:hypothetical protein
MNESTLTYRSTSQLREGHRISIDEPDRRWWKRVLHFLLRRPPPVVRRLYRVTAVSSSSEIKVAELKNLGIEKRRGSS